jgi:hypothetical protein
MQTEIRPDAKLARATPREVAAELRALLEGGARLQPAGRAAADPAQLLRPRNQPTHKVELFDATFYVTDPKEDDDIGFVVAYVALRRSGRGGRTLPARAVHPRIFYKDLSLMWRVATHYVRSDDDTWIGKGDVKWVEEDGVMCEYSAEETANLPLELQAALDAVRGEHHPERDLEAVPLVLRRAPAERLAPYADFSAPRRKAMAEQRINAGRPIAAFERAGDPASLRFTPGFEPDFDRGQLATSRSASRLYGGKVAKHRILSRNRRVQYQFVAARRHAWINPPQALTTELSSYGVRTVDVLAPEELFVPAFEYHFVEDGDDGPCLHSQIPAGWAGAPSPLDPQRADASAWIEALPVMGEFRKKVLAR